MKAFNLQNRRYIGSKTKLIEWIFKELGLDNIESACDIFAGSGVIASQFATISNIKNIIINDILFSNEMIYHAFFKGQDADFKSLQELKKYYNKALKLEENYFSQHFSDKFFSHNDCIKIGSIREHIESLNLDKLNKDILLTSLIYSMDKIANTVGHYEAYRKKEILQDRFVFELISPIKHNKNIIIERQNANTLAKTLKTDLVFLDPPYNSRQYSRFYHLYENLVQWKKPKLYGTALKPKCENMSEYCRSNAKKELSDLIEKLDCKIIALTYNNTYNSKSSSSQNKISFENIIDILSQKGKLSIKEKAHSFFNSGKTDFKEHKEFLFIVEVKS
ncbi:DNA adenine methylase [Helicobacter cetorum]|uniref:DNA adenine methylase n=1 Tax=Helicobacter cetorum TaxID=138563 RepID=UPI000CF0732F|nr:DNA adenine methylase [Helicobacter cetorum]